MGMHHANQLRVRHDLQGSIKATMEAVDYLNAKCEASIQRKGPAKAWYPETLVPRDVARIWESARHVMDGITASYMSGEVNQEKFEEQFERACSRMITFCDKVYIPMLKKKGKQENELMTVYRMKADFVRQLCCSCPKHFATEEVCREAYNTAIEMRYGMSHWDHGVISTYV